MFFTTDALSSIENHIPASCGDWCDSAWPVENRHVIQLISDPAFVPIVGIR